MMNNDNMMPHDREQELEGLFRRYREACVPPEPAVNFMPALWQKIEARQSKSLFFERIARTFVAGAMAACGFLGVMLLLPARQMPVTAASFVEDLANANARETVPYLDPVRFDFTQDSSDGEYQ